MPMTAFLIIAIVILAILAFGGVFLIFKKSKRDSLQDANLENLKNDLKEIRGELKESLQKNLVFLQTQRGQDIQMVKEIYTQLEELKSTNKQVMNFTDQLQNLQDILKNPKQRGILGEYYLETVLKNVLPPGSYKMQYKLSEELTVDAVVFAKDKIIPIDAKFSLENYNRIIEERDPGEKERLEKLFKQDLKQRIDETSKYIQPSLGTMDFAFMFIPAEAIYYDLLINQVGTVKISTRDLIEYAFKEKRVIIVSPTSFLAYLQTVLQGLRALQIEEKTKEIRKKIEDLHKHLISYNVFMQKLGNNLGTTVNMYNQAYQEFAKIDKDVVKITEGERAVEPREIDKPTIIS